MTPVSLEGRFKKKFYPEEVLLLVREGANSEHRSKLSKRQPVWQLSEYMFFYHGKIHNVIVNYAIF
jgi:hypothetical protein